MATRLRLVLPAERPLAKLSLAEKLAQAKAYLQRRGIYILDRGAPKPKWGRNEIPAEDKVLLERIIEDDRKRLE